MRSEGTLSLPLRTGTGKPLPITVTPPLPPVAAVATCRLPRMLWRRPPPSGRDHGVDYNDRDAPRSREPLTKGSIGEGLRGTRSTRLLTRVRPGEKE